MAFPHRDHYGGKNKQRSGDWIWDYVMHGLTLYVKTKRLGWHRATNDELELVRGWGLSCFN